MEWEIQVVRKVIAFVLLISSAAVGAQERNCRLGKGFTFKNRLFAPCEITGHSASGKQKVYQARCDAMPEFQHLEFEKGAMDVVLLDSSSRYELAKCQTEKEIIEQMIKSYDGKVNALENPPCYLTQWKGQMMIKALDVRARCTFDIKKAKADEFTKKIGKAALYQCEKGYFIVMPKTGAAEIFRPKKESWESVCLAPTKVGEAVDNIDWKNPPDYYSP